MDDTASRPLTLTNIIPEHERVEQIEGGGGSDIGIYHKNRGGFTKMTITLSTVCLLVGGLVRGVWDVSEYSHVMTDSQARITNLEAAYKVQSAALDIAQRALANNADRVVDLQSRIGGLEQGLNQANSTVQKLAESNGRLDERVIFLMAQIEGRMSAPQNGGRKRD